VKRKAQALTIFGVSLCLTAVVVYAGWWLNARLTATPQQSSTPTAAASVALANPIEASRDDSQRRIHITSYRDALQRYGADVGVYPVSGSVIQMKPEGVPFTNLAGTYVPLFLTDPRSSDGRTYYYIATQARFAVCADLVSKPGTRFVGLPEGTREEQGSAKTCTL
jgi:hypothetical protein